MRKPMIKQFLPKSFWLALMTASLFAFIAVNVHARFSPPLAKTADQELLHQQGEEAAEKAERKLVLPDLTVLGRVVDLIQHIMPRY